MDHNLRFKKKPVQTVVRIIENVQNSNFDEKNYDKSNENNIDFCFIIVVISFCENCS